MKGVVVEMVMVMMVVVMIMMVVMMLMMMVLEVVMVIFEVVVKGLVSGDEDGSGNSYSVKYDGGSSGDGGFKGGC